MILVQGDAWRGGLPPGGEWVAWVALAGVMVVAVSGVGRRVWVGLLRGCGRVGRREAVGVGVCALLSLAVTAGAGLVAGPARPRVHDEFSNVLAGETFAKGRLTNPTHPMWRHFETLHVLQRPTYQSKYPPAQGVALAMGIVLADEPALGVWIVVAGAVGAMAWMLYGFVPPRWALLGGMLCALHPLMLQWGWLLWGGAVAALGGALVAGAMRRLMDRPGAGMAVVLGVVLGVGAVILANSRPYEGMLVCVPVGVVLVARMVRRGGWGRIAVPAGLVLALGAGAMGYYNWRVTGDAMVTPYQLHDRTYTMAPHFVFQAARGERVYRHAALREIHGEWEMSLWREQQTLGGWGRAAGRKLARLAGVALQPVFAGLALLALGRALRRVRGLWVGVACAALLTAGMLVVTWNVLAHYAAPLLPWWMVMVTACLAELRGGWRGRVRRVVVAGWVFVAGWAVVEQARLQAGGWEQARVSIVDALRRESMGKDLVMVRPLAGHTAHVEWVYNAADIDAADAVFAREMSAEEDAELMNHFADRTVWLLEVDGERVRMNPYPGR